MYNYSVSYIAAVLHDIIIVNSEIMMHVIVCDLVQYMLTYLQYNRSYTVTLLVFVVGITPILCALPLGFHASIPSSHFLGLHALETRLGSAKNFKQLLI